MEVSIMLESLLGLKSHNNLMRPGLHVLNKDIVLF